MERCSPNSTSSCSLLRILKVFQKVTKIFVEGGQDNFGNKIPHNYGSKTFVFKKKWYHQAWDIYLYICRLKIGSFSFTWPSPKKQRLGQLVNKILGMLFSNLAQRLFFSKPGFTWDKNFDKINCARYIPFVDWWPFLFFLTKECIISIYFFCFCFETEFTFTKKN